LSLICFKDVTFFYPKRKTPALLNVNLSIEEGEIFVIMGENTAGKTTFCKLINGIAPLLTEGKMSGKVFTDGIDTGESCVSKLALKAGMVLDDPDAQIFTQTVFHEAAFALENILLEPDEIKSRVNMALNAVGLNGFEDRMPNTLSGGEKQRLAIAACIAMKGKILVLDEPLCRLDPDGAKEVIAVLLELRKKHNMTIVMTSHDSEVASKIADRVCILKEGKIAALDTPGNIFANNELLYQTGLQPLESKVFNFSSVRIGSCGSWLKEKKIEIKNLSFKYPNGIGIQNIDLTVEENDFIALIGKNGCGKTTLIKNIAGLLKPASGEIFINGKNSRLLKTYDIAKEIGFVMQNPDTQLFTDSVLNDICFGLKNLRMKKNEMKKRAQFALEAVGLQNEADSFPHALNKSDRTKAVIACVLAMGAKTLIFDEIDVGNDYNGNIKIMELVKELNAQGFTIIFITHNMFLAEGFAKRIIKMNREGIISDERRE